MAKSKIERDDGPPNQISALAALTARVGADRILELGPDTLSSPVLVCSHEGRTPIVFFRSDMSLGGRELAAVEALGYIAEAEANGETELAL